RTLLLRCYLCEAILSSVALPAFVAGPLCFPEYRGPWVAVGSGVLIAIILGALYGGNSFGAKMNGIQDLKPASLTLPEGRSRRYATLNIAIALAGTGLLVKFASRPAPRTEGIIEATPIERARRDGGTLPKPLLPVKPLPSSSR